MKKEPLVFLDHIIESIDLLEKYIEDTTEATFARSIQLQDSCIRRLEIIGEAVKNLPTDLKAKNPKLPWKKIAGMRDMLIHKYFGVDMELTWAVLTKELPILKKNILKLRNQLAKQSKQ